MQIAMHHLQYTYLFHMQQIHIYIYVCMYVCMYIDKIYCIWQEPPNLAVLSVATSLLLVIESGLEVRFLWLGFNDRGLELLLVSHEPSQVFVFDLVIKRVGNFCEVKVLIFWN